MPILETGEKNEGFTLLEMVAVITLIGLISLLALPRIRLSLEQVEVGYIGKLIRSDFRQIKNESFMEPSSKKAITFNPSGYSFNIGDCRIVRHFHYQFKFALPQKAEEENAAPDSGASSNVDDQQIEADPSATVQDKAENSSKTEINDGGVYEIDFTDGELSGNEAQLRWQTGNFEGALLCKADGTVEWQYQRRRPAQ